ncbi:MAG: hypothetical protein M1834_003787 [Cirrosporium novae-zelandiae]|nr:MAG: hypothetical protein M1834_003787 [Cirrosporium novae-zelandiae]
MSFLRPSTATQPSLFPIYLLPSLPFSRRRRKSSTTSTDSTSSTPDTPTSPEDEPKSPSYLHGHTSHLRCLRCSAPLALSSQIISKGFTGRHGRAYLVSPTPYASPISCLPSSSSSEKAKESLPNTYTHKAVPRQLVTGAHTVSDISCAFCGSVLGWKYVGADEESQRYKIGKFILETRRVSVSVCWEGGEEIEELGGWEKLPRNRNGEDGEVEFDSQDEDECEDLFAGVWSPELAARRRRGRKLGTTTATENQHQKGSDSLITLDNKPSKRPKFNTSPPPATSFTFVDNNSMAPKTQDQKVIRAHVMREYRRRQRLDQKTVARVKWREAIVSSKQETSKNTEGEAGREDIWNEHTGENSTERHRSGDIFIYHGKGGRERKASSLVPSPRKKIRVGRDGKTRRSTPVINSKKKRAIIDYKQWYGPQGFW